MRQLSIVPRRAALAVLLALMTLSLLLSTVSADGDSIPQDPSAVVGDDVREFIRSQERQAEAERDTTLPVAEEGNGDAGEAPPDLNGDDVPLPVKSEAFQSMQRVLDDMRRKQQNQDCEAPFGDVLGEVHGVTAHSNCNDRHVSMEDSVLSFVLPGQSSASTHVTGMKWQCVEFARRYLLQTYGYVFGDVMGAVDIWRFTSLHKPGNEEARVHLGRYTNHDDADRWPEKGAVVIWPIQNDMPFGHVAIVSDVIPIDPADADKEAKQAEDDNEFTKAPAGAKARRRPRRVAIVRVGDQNYKSEPWPNKEYAREMYLETYDGEYFGLVDEYGYRTFGWMQYEEFIKPLDYLLHDDRDLPGMPRKAIATDAPRMTGDEDPTTKVLKDGPAVDRG